MSQTVLENRRQQFKLEKIKKRNLKEITLMCVHADEKPGYKKWVSYGLKSSVRKNISNRQHHIVHQHLTFTRVLPVVLATALVPTDHASDLLPVLVLHNRAFAHRRGWSRR